MHPKQTLLHKRTLELPWTGLKPVTQTCYRQVSWLVEV